MSQSDQQPLATMQFPAMIPPQLAEVPKELTSLIKTLLEAIEFYRRIPEKNIFSEKEAAEFFGISLKSMREIRNAGQINYTPVKGQFFYLRQFLADYIEREQAFKKGAKKK